MEGIKSHFSKRLIIIYIVVFVIAVFLLNWLIKSQAAGRNKNQAENFNKYYKELAARCDNKDKKAYDCCFNSVVFMAAYNLRPAGISCEPGYKINTYECLGSFKWCEIIR